MIEVLQEEVRVAHNAQRSEIIDLYVNQLLRSGARPHQLKEVLNILQEPQSSKLDATREDDTNPPSDGD